MERQLRTLVTGAAGMVGRAVVRQLCARGHTALLTPGRAELDLTSEDAVDRYFAEHRPEQLFMIAAKVGGIAANVADPVGFITENVRIQANLFAAAHRHGVRRSLFLGSSCIYPRDCPQPMREEHLLSGPLEPTNEGYALAKILGIRLAEAYRRQHGMDVVCAMPCNVYGTGDHFDLQRSHVLSALVRRFVDAKDTGADSLVLWGTGVARREFIHVDDVVEALLILFEVAPKFDFVNVGTGVDVSIRELASMIASEVGYVGECRWDATRPDGMPKKCLEVSRLRGLGFTPHVSLAEGIRRTVAEYRVLKAEGRVDG